MDERGGDNWGRLSTAIGTLSEAKIFIDDTPSIGVLEMRAKCRRLASEHGLHLVMVSYRGQALMYVLHLTDSLGTYKLSFESSPGAERAVAHCLASPPRKLSSTPILVVTTRWR